MSFTINNRSSNFDNVPVHPDKNVRPYRDELDKAYDPELHNTTQKTTENKSQIQNPIFQSLRMDDFVNVSTRPSNNVRPYRDDLDKAYDPELHNTTQKTTQESLNIQSLRSGINAVEIRFVDKIKPVDLNAAYEPNTNQIKLNSDSNNPLNAQIDNVDANRLSSMLSSKISSRQFATQIMSNPKLYESPELKSEVTNFLSKLPIDEREALVYTNEILNRNPSIPNDQLKLVFNNLSRMMDTKYDDRAGNIRDLVMSGLHDIAIPSNISQGSVGTCAATSVQIQAAIRRPADYLNMLDSLAKNQPYQTVSGDKIPPNWTFVNDTSGRSISSKIMQNAIMDFADGDRRDYNSQTLYSVDPKALPSNQDGILNKEASMALSSITGQKFNVIEDEKDHNKVFEKLKESKPSRSNPVQISMIFDDTQTDPSKPKRDARHAVNVIDINANNATIINPWGREEIIPLETLRARIYGVIANN